MPELATIDYLLGDAAIVAAVSSRVRPYARSQGESLPAVVVSRLSGGPLYADDGVVGLTRVSMRVVSYGETYASAKELSELVFARLSAVRDVTQGSTMFRFITIDTEQDKRESGSNAYRYEYSIEQTYIMWVQ